jgi:hypothetical protein
LSDNERENGGTIPEWLTRPAQPSPIVRQGKAFRPKKSAASIGGSLAAPAKRVSRKIMRRCKNLNRIELLKMDAIL